MKKFQSFPACAEFLQNLPEHDNSQVSVESGSALGNLTLNESSSLSSSASSRFLIFKHVTEAVTANVEGRVIFTAFVVPRKVDSVFKIWNENFNSVFSSFTPRGYESITWHPSFWFKFSAVWLWVLSEDEWVEKKFGKLEHTQDDDQGRTIICHFHLWPRKFGAAPEKEEASAADPQARESWNRAIAQVMPPATAWDQERWDIQEVPRLERPEPEFDPEENPEYYREQQAFKKEFLECHGFEVAESSQ